MLSIIYPMLVLLLIIVNNGWDKIHILQRLMLIIYLIFELIVLVLLAKVLYISYLQWHLFPGSVFLGEGVGKYCKYIKEYYYPRLMIIPIQNFLIQYYCGTDIGSIIISYLKIGKNDDIVTFDEFNKQLKSDDLKLGL